MAQALTLAPILVYRKLCLFSQRISLILLLYIESPPVYSSFLILLNISIYEWSLSHCVSLAVSHFFNLVSLFFAYTRLIFLFLILGQAIGPEYFLVIVLALGSFLSVSTNSRHLEGNTFSLSLVSLLTSMEK